MADGWVGGSAANEEKYFEYKLLFSDEHEYVWSFYQELPILDEIEKWYRESIFENTKFHRSNDYGHIMIGTNSPADAIKIKLSWGGKW